MFRVLASRLDASLDDSLEWAVASHCLGSFAVECLELAVEV